jgi:WD repeat-containing protein 48
MSGSGAPSLRSFVDGQDQGRAQHRMRAEDEYEILCNDTLLPLGMSLAAVRQFVWKSSAELVMHYRKKRMQLHPGHSA